jgi:osmotically-inducible protein OsmY
MKVLILTSLATISLAALLTACGDTSTNVNVRSNNGVTNLGANNANVGAVVVNSNTNASTNANRWSNANSVTREEYDRERAEYEKDKGSSTIGTGANDSWIWFKTRAALMATDDLRESTINVDVENAVITLRGSVGSAAQKSRAEQVANGIEGKSRVVNQLTVAANDSVTNMSSNSNRGNTNR